MAIAAILRIKVFPMDIILFEFWRRGVRRTWFGGTSEKQKAQSRKQKA
jgi:hypothetical protein